MHFYVKIPSNIRFTLLITKDWIYGPVADGGILSGNYKEYKGL
jgi:hypothetical protein